MLLDVCVGYLKQSKQSLNVGNNSCQQGLSLVLENLEKTINIKAREALELANDRKWGFWNVAYGESCQKKLPFRT